MALTVREEANRNNQEIELGKRIFALKENLEKADTPEWRKSLEHQIATLKAELAKLTEAHRIANGLPPTIDGGTF